MILLPAAMPCSPSRRWRIRRPVTLRVLAPEKDEHSWPNLMGKLIFAALFGGNEPAFRDLVHQATNTTRSRMTSSSAGATCYWLHSGLPCRSTVPA